MSIWIEFRCEGRGRSSEDCWSDTNSGPMQMSCDDTQAGVINTLRDLAKDAMAAKWVRTKDGWLCPACRSHALPSQNGKTP